MLFLKLPQACRFPFSSGSPPHPGQSLGAGGGVSAPEGSHRAVSASFAGLLQLFGCRHEGLGVVAASYRSLAFEPQSAQDTIQDGDSPIHSVVSTHLSGDSRQLGEVSACVDSIYDFPRSPVGLCQFPGFSSPETSRLASLNWRRVSVLR